jgi:hypothetical protein
MALLVGWNVWAKCGCSDLMYFFFVNKDLLYIIGYQTKMIIVVIAYQTKVIVKEMVL